MGISTTDLLLACAWTASMILCGLIAQRWLALLRGAEGAPGSLRNRPKWPIWLMWFALSGALYSYFSNDMILALSLGFLAGCALGFDLVALRDALRRAGGKESIRRVK